MVLFHTAAEVSDLVARTHAEDRTVGLVPTMGALHAGHASLVSRSLAENDLTVVSIFVNPTQFNDPSDLERYPRTLEADCALLDTLSHDVVVFAPSVTEIYPEPDTRRFSYPPIDTVMEGARRPGHFNGVCQIVSRLFDIAQPTRAYFGEKDFQQIAVIRAMTDDLNYSLTLVPCPIVREESGLALSSRNSLLTPDERTTAVAISATLFDSVEYSREHSVADTLDHVVSTLNAIEGLDVEYFEIVDAITLQPVTTWEQAPHVQGCITVNCGSTPIRLIDNICYR